MAWTILASPCRTKTRFRLSSGSEAASGRGSTEAVTSGGGDQPGSVVRERKAHIWSRLPRFPSRTGEKSSRSLSSGEGTDGATVYDYVREGCSGTYRNAKKRRRMAMTACRLSLGNGKARTHDIVHFSRISNSSVSRKHRKSNTPSVNVQHCSTVALIT